jgi:hypothetical protein
MSRSRFLSSISVVALAGCPTSDHCGPGSAASDGLVASATGVTVTYANLIAGANNDCPPGPGAMPVPLTILTPPPTTDVFTICVPHPDKLGKQTLSLATDIQQFAANTMAAGCSYAVDFTTPPTGTVTATGVCNNGTAHAGFALTMNGSFMWKRTCGATVDLIPATIAGTIAVAGP